VVNIFAVYYFLGLETKVVIISGVALHLRLAEGKGKIMYSNYHFANVKMIWVIMHLQICSSQK